MRRLQLFLLYAFIAPVLAAAPTPSPGTDSAKLAAVPECLKRFVQDETVSGAVTLIARHDRILAIDAVGLADIANHKAMCTDTLFWIASMTKPITAVAVFLLQD